MGSVKYEATFKAAILAVVSQPLQLLDAQLSTGEISAENNGFESEKAAISEMLTKTLSLKESHYAKLKESHYAKMQIKHEL